MTDPVLRHQDSPHVAMPFEVDPQQVEYFALHPVGRLPHALKRRHARVVARQLHLQHRAVAMRVREQVIDHLDPVLVIDAALVGQAVHRELGILIRETADFDDRSGVNHREWIRLLLGYFQHPIAEPALDPLEYLERLHLLRLPLPALRWASAPASARPWSLL